MISIREVKRLLKGGAKHFGFEIRRVEPHLMDFIVDRGVDVVLDVGANVGQFGESLRGGGYKGKIISFEPIRAVYEALSVKAAADGNWEGRNFALGAKSEETNINVSESSVFSSILSTTRAAARFDNHASISRVERIEVKRLDDTDVDLSHNILLKIDTQGYEKAVLEGGRHTVTKVKGVLLELPIIHLYEGSWQLQEAIEYMSQLGLVLAQVRPVNYHAVDRVSLVEVDCLFRPRDGRLD